ncbi:hypothetical protein E2C01_049825 [Portunus trituberculatus]|uniref:Uncharacterized protein n=1 Tax=Portunus trituberculatus TaxID=210409 RepID=A0A5B7G6M4_PORTR|nr:hypothetical protein [Portunus trituberculatus]
MVSRNSTEARGCEERRSGWRGLTGAGAGWWGGAGGRLIRGSVGLDDMKQGHSRNFSKEVTKRTSTGRSLEELVQGAGSRSLGEASWQSKGHSGRGHSYGFKV